VTLSFPRWLLLAAVVWLAGCAQAPKVPAAEGEKAWSGRLALTVEGQPGNSLSAGFHLRGAPRAGELTLLNPLGGTLAVLAWAPGSATLKSGSEVRQFESLEALATQATGAALPIAALFDWLDGMPTPVPGWQVDVSQLAQGRLRAQRSEPPPLADLRVAIDP
jgi:outer membrane lipoprotein LolB